jgi:hypothetical protein
METAKLPPFVGKQKEFLGLNYYQAPDNIQNPKFFLFSYTGLAVSI